MTKDEALRLALEVLEDLGMKHYENTGEVLYKNTYTAIKAALEAKDEPVGLIESLKDAKPCCGQYETCWRACTPRGKFIGQRDAQRTWVGLTKEELKPICDEWRIVYGAWMVDFARDIEIKLKEKNS